MKRFYSFISIFVCLIIFNCLQTVEEKEKERPFAKWVTQTKITAVDSEDDDYLGASVSLSGDYAIVGANGKDGSGTNKGAAYITHRIATNLWSAGEKITAVDSEDYDNFGCSVSISGNYLIIGALYEDGAGTDRGAAYIFK